MTHIINLNITPRVPRPCLSELEIAEEIATIVRRAWPGLACTINIILHEEEKPQ